MHKTAGPELHPSLARMLFALLLVLGCHNAIAQKVVQVAAAHGNHNLMLREDGSVWGWGANDSGQLGDGTQISRTAPAPVSGLTGVRQVAVGAHHSLALKTDGTVWAWGYNYDGEVGDGGTVTRLTPTQVTGLKGVIAIAGGAFHSLAVMSNGTVWAWGSNDSGQLGDGGPIMRSTPIQVPGLTGVIAVAGGGSHTLAVMSNGTVWAWGGNALGQLGDGSTESRLTPINVPSLTGVTSVSAGTIHSLALRNEGTVLVWGSDDRNQLGDGSFNCPEPRLIPAPVTGLTNVVAIAGGGYHSLAVKADGTTWALGGLNWQGEVGDGTITTRIGPIQVLGVTGAVAVSAGRFHSVALTTDGKVWTWGNNPEGVLGYGGILSRPSQELVPGAAGMAAVAAGVSYSLALKTDGTVQAWGANGYGQLGDGTHATRSSSMPVLGLTTVTAMAARGDQSLFLKADGTVWTWGSADSLPPSAPAQVPGLASVTAIAAGSTHFLALKADSTIWAWGSNDFGELGDGSTQYQSTPVQVTAITGAIALAAGGHLSVALKGDGTVWTWGSTDFENVNYSGDDGGGDGGIGCGGGGGSGDAARKSAVSKVLASSAPSPVSGLTNVVGIAAGSNHFLAVKSDGTVWAAGYNGSGQLGDGTTTTRSSATMVAGLSGVSALAAGASHSVALKGDGTVWAWGAAVATGFPANVNTPSMLPFPRGIKRLAAALSHTLAIDSRGRVMAWGVNSTGQLGVPSPENSPVAKKVLDPLDPGVTRGARAIIEFLNDRIGQGHHFITSSFQEAKAIDAGGAGLGWARTGRSWRAWSALAEVPAGISAKPVYRFYAGGPNSHFFTVEEAEKNTLLSLNPTQNAALGWKLEGVDFYAIPPVAATVGTPLDSRDNFGLTCPADYYPVYRAYNNRFAFNDSNHRITSSYIDVVRGLRFFGWTDEGIAFCSPKASATGGDLQAYHTFPGDQVATQSAIVSEHFFINAGPGDAPNATLQAALPQGLNWVVTCKAGFGAVCPSAPQLAAVDELAVGVTLANMPAGGIVKLTARATTPGTPGSIEFASAINVPADAPDPWTGNNLTNVSKTVVSTPVVCTATLSTGRLSIAASGTATSPTQITVIAPASCSWTVAGTQPWVRFSPASGSGTALVAVSVDASSLGEPRQATFTAAANTNLERKSTSVVVQSAVATLPGPASIPACAQVVLGREAEQLGPNIIQGSVGIVALNCAWEAGTTQNWITITRGATGVGTGSVQFQVQANPDALERKGAIMVAGKRLDIVQSGIATLVPSTTDTANGDAGGDGGSSGGDGGSSGGDSG